jgi:hypothetical protein
LKHAPLKHYYRGFGWRRAAADGPWDRLRATSDSASARKRKSGKNEKTIESQRLGFACSIGWSKVTQF